MSPTALASPAGHCLACASAGNQIFFRKKFMVYGLIFSLLCVEAVVGLDPLGPLLTQDILNPMCWDSVPSQL